MLFNLALIDCGLIGARRQFKSRWTPSPSLRRRRATMTVNAVLNE